MPATLSSRVLVRIDALPVIVVVGGFGTKVVELKTDWYPRTIKRPVHGTGTPSIGPGVKVPLRKRSRPI
jgi:hypothetical protein